MLKKRIYAILFQLSSSDEHPRQVHCPSGERSWCVWQRANTQGKDQGSHTDHDILSAEIGKKLVPISQRLTDTNLLKRCSRVRTQNTNESLHHLIWKICPKAIYVGKKTIETAVTMSVCQFSMGASFQSMLLKALSMDLGAFLEQGSNEKDFNRLKKAKKSITGRFREKRKSKGIQQEQKKQTQEGTTYVAGEFISAPACRRTTKSI